MIGDNKNILHSRGLVELHVHLDAHEIHVHELQGHVHSDGTQQSLRNGPLKSTAMLTPPDHSFTILDQQRPPESLLGKSQHSSLTLMSGIPFKVTRRWSVGTTNVATLSASLLGVTFKYSRPLSRIRPFCTLKSMHPSPSMCHPSNSWSRVSLFGDDISLRILSHSIRDFMVPWSCQIGTRLNASAAPFSDPL